MNARRALLVLFLTLLLGTAVSGIAAQTPTPGRGCQDLLPTRLIIHERGRVARNDPAPVNVRAAPGTNEEQLGQLPVGAIFYVLEGPNCTVRYTWYRVSARVEGEPLEGWIAEGDARAWFVERYPPGM